MPFTESGSGMPAASRIVGATSMTWLNCERISPFALMPFGQWTIGAVARPAPVRRDLLGPLVRRVHRVRPADGVVVVRLGPTELVDPGGEVLGRLQRLKTVEIAHLVVAAVERSLRRRRRCRRRCSR